MRCQKCGTEIPEGKIYCERCGNAVQIVPDYDPDEDYTIGAEEKEEPDRRSSASATTVPWRYRWRYGLAGICLLVAGSLTYQLVFSSVFHKEETVSEPEEEEHPPKPEFGIQPGTYSYSPQLALIHEEQEQGEIYYTTDGTTPDEQSTLYKAPFFIGEGTTVVRAIYIRGDGMQSEEATGTYQIVFPYPEEPVFSVPAGSYDSSFSVTITAEEGCRIYYTTNGEEPGYQSKLYRGPVYIPAGLTVLQAVSVDEDGGMSGIVEAVYDISEAPDIPDQETGDFQA